MGRSGPRGRRRAIVLASAMAIAVVVVLVILVGPWAGRLGLPWLGRGESPAVRVVGGDDAWHRRPVTLHFRDVEGKPVRAQYRVDGGPWRLGRRVRITAPMSHADDGVHTVTARIEGGSAPAATVKVRIDTTPPVLRAVTVMPQHIAGPSRLHLAYDAVAEPGVTVTWAVVDTLGDVVGERGERHPAAGPESVTWPARTAAGKVVFPGTYRVRVKALDAAGNRAVVEAPFACERPVPAKLYRNLPQAGNLVALTFDGGSGYAWRHIMIALVRMHAVGTFFSTGVSVDDYPEVAQEAVARHMTIGNHSFDHPDFTTIGYAEMRRQLLANAKAWWRACKATPAPFFRPPYGAYDATTLKAAGRAGYPFVVNWDVDTGDWTGASAATIAQRAVSAARPGSIICMHTEWNTEAAVPAVVKGLRAKGLEPVGLDELFHAAGLL